jgi:hypothetical protein
MLNEQIPAYHHSCRLTGAKDGAPQRKPSWNPTLGQQWRSTVHWFRCRMWSKGTHRLDIRLAGRMMSWSYYAEPASHSVCCPARGCDCARISTPGADRPTDRGHTHGLPAKHSRKILSITMLSSNIKHQDVLQGPWKQWFFFQVSLIFII